MKIATFFILAFLVSALVMAQTPQSVEDLTVELASDGVRLCWSEVNGALYYKVYERYGNSPFVLADSTEMTCFYSENYHPTMENCYYVTAMLEGGVEISSSEVCKGFEALNFSVVDIHGNVFDLFEKLEGGQFVFIDFFNYTCINCREAIPFIVESYYRYGCNTGDVFYVEINATNGDELCFQWCEEFGVDFPTISVDGGARKFSALYHIDAAPHFIMIAPDHSIVLDGGSSGFYIFDLQSIIDAFEPLGINVKDCNADLDETEEKMMAVYPNPANDFVNVDVGEASWVRIYNVMGKLMDSFVVDNGQTKLVTERYPNGMFFIQADGKYVVRFVVQH